MGSVFEPATAAIIVYTAENTVSTLIWGLEPVEFVLHSVPVRTVGRAGILLSYCSTHVLWLRQALATQAYDLTPAQLNSSRLVTHSAHLIGARFEKPTVNERTMLTFAPELQMMGPESVNRVKTRRPGSLMYRFRSGIGNVSPCGGEEEKSW